MSLKLQMQRTPVRRSRTGVKSGSLEEGNEASLSNARQPSIADLRLSFISQMRDEVLGSFWYAKLIRGASPTTKLFGCSRCLRPRPSRKRRIVGEVIYIDPSHAETCLSEQGYGFVRELDEALGSVAVVLRTLEQGGSSRICLHTLSTKLLDLLALVEPEPLIEAAVDQLAWAARRLVAARQREGQPEPERHRELGAAYLRLRGRVALARPRYKTRQMG